MITSLYASLIAGLIAWLSLRVIRLRRFHRVLLGDGGEPELLNTIRAQGNALEYAPLSLILLALAELGGAYSDLIHLGGVTLIAGRVLHARALLRQDLRLRVLGMQLTFAVLVGLALLNLALFSAAGPVSIH